MGDFGGNPALCLTLSFSDVIGVDDGDVKTMLRQLRDFTRMMESVSATLQAQSVNARMESQAGYTDSTKDNKFVD